MGGLQLTQWQSVKLKELFLHDTPKVSLKRIARESDRDWSGLGRPLLAKGLVQPVGIPTNNLVASASSYVDGVSVGDSMCQISMSRHELGVTSAIITLAVSIEESPPLAQPWTSA